jgi:hypothetical protein
MVLNPRFCGTEHDGCVAELSISLIYLNLELHATGHMLKFNLKNMHRMDSWKGGCSISSILDTWLISQLAITYL